VADSRGKKWDFLKNYSQVLLVIATFSLMVLSSYLFVSSRERSHLRKNAEDVFVRTESNIKADMMESEALLGSISETIRDMIIQGKNAEEIYRYILHINDYLRLKTNHSLIAAFGFYGVFHVFDNLFLRGVDGWQPPHDFNPENRPWYYKAVQAGGGTGVTHPYKDAYSDEIIITFSRTIYDGESRPLGIIGLDITLNRIKGYVLNARFIEAGYGFMLSEDLDVIAYPDPSYIGKKIPLNVLNIPALSDNSLERGVLVEGTTKDYRGISSIVFVKKLFNGWNMGIITPSHIYFSSTRNLAIILSALGTIFAALLISFLMRISKEKNTSEDRMQKMFNATPLGMTFWDRKFNVIDCNDNIVNMFGLSGKQEFRERFFDLSPEFQSDGVSARERMTGYFDRAMESGSLRFEWMHQKLSGEPVPCEVMLIRDRFDDDFILMGYFRDLREIKSMMKEVVSRARLLDTVTTAATILLAGNEYASFETSLLKSFDILGHCLDVDRVQIWRNEVNENDLYFVLRYEWLSDFGKGCTQIPYGLQFPYSMKPNWENLFLRGENINAPLYELSQDDQDFLGYYDIKSIVIIPMFLDGDFWGFFSLSDCRRERTFSQEEVSILSSAGLMMSTAVNRNNQIMKMREAEERTQIMIDSAPICAFFWDKNMRVIDCNEEAVKMFDLIDKQEFIDKFSQLSPAYQPDGILSTVKGGLLVRKALKDGYSRFEWLHQKLNGELIPAEITCVRVKHRDDFTVTEYIRDLREQKAMIAEMRKAEIAEESSKAKSEFLARMSHEIRTPMNAILGITEIQLQDNELPQTTKDALERIYNSGDLLLGIINDILDLSKIESGKLEIVPAQYDIASLVHDTVQLNIMRYESKPIVFKLRMDENTPIILVGDELRIKQILNNLLTNAFKYTDEGTVNLDVSAENDIGNSSTLLIFRVSDTGQGMSSEQLSKLGSEYSRFNMEANRKTEGTGLGMSITRNLIRLMNGDIEIESTPGVGSVFTVRLPQKYIDNQSIGKDMAENLMQLNHASAVKIRNVQVKKEYMPYGSVLVVDDVETNLYVAKGLLAPYGLSIDIALSGFEAIEKIKDGNVYDIIFMDHMMPVMDGIEAARVIRGTGYSKPIVALTANALTGQAEMFMHSGFDDFISKPIDIRRLNIILNKLIRDRTPPEIIEAARQKKVKMQDVNQQTIASGLAEFFVRDAKKSMKVLESIYLNNCRRVDDMSMFVINVHAMKSALANVGENELSAEAAKLEHLGRDKNVTDIMSLLPIFMEKLFAVICKYEPEEVSDENVESDNSLLKEKLEAIKIECIAYNKKSAKDLLSHLRQKQWPSETRNWLGIIAEHLLHSEFDEAARAIEDFVNQL